MKQFIMLSLLFIGLAVESKTMSSEEVKAFLADEKKHLSEDGAPPFYTLQDIAFHCYVAEDWRRTLALLENDAPDRRRQELIIIASEHLPPRDYVKFLNGVCDLMESGRLMTGGDFFCYRDCHRSDFFAYYHEQPEVASLIERLELVCKTQGQERWEVYFSEIKSGAGKKKIIEDLSREGRPIPDAGMYTENSNEAYRRLLELHQKLLNGKTMRELWAEEANGTPSQAVQETREPDRIIAKLDDDSVIVRLAEPRDDAPEETAAKQQPPVARGKKQPAAGQKKPTGIAAKSEHPQGEPAKSKGTPWALLLLISVITIGSVAVWHRLKKK